MAKKKTREELAFPIATIPSMSPSAKPAENPAVIKRIILGAIKGAFHKETPKEPNQWQSEYGKKQQPVVSEEEIQFVVHLIESLQPANAIEAALASQFAISYIRGLEQAQDYHGIAKTIEIFRFGHEVLEALTKFRTKGAQLIQVNYNHNQAQFNHCNIDKSNGQQQPVIEVSNG